LAVAALLFGQFADDRGERVGYVGTQSEVRVPELLASSLDLLRGGRRIIRQ
jgi:hypothetical protein